MLKDLWTALSCRLQPRRKLVCIPLPPPWKTHETSSGTYVSSRKAAKDIVAIRKWVLVIRVLSLDDTVDKRLVFGRARDKPPGFGRPRSLTDK